MEVSPKRRPTGPLSNKPNINAYSDMLKEMKNKYQPKAYAKSKKVKKAREDYRNSPEAREDVISMLEYTPAAIPMEAYRQTDNIMKGNYLDAAIEGGVGIAMGLAPLGVKPLVKYGSKKIKSGYESLKNLFQGPLSPQYNSEGGSVYAADGINPKKIFKQKAVELVNRLLGNKKVSAKERAELEELVAFKEEMKIDYPDSDMTFHRSTSPNLKITGKKDDPNAFRYRSINLPNKAGFNQGNGIFTFGLEDTPKFESFGQHIYAGVYPKNTKVFPGKMDTGSNLNEIFIKENNLEDLIKVK